MKKKFLPPNYFSRKRVRNRGSWRKPRGVDNKRGRISARGPVPTVGWRTPKSHRYKHPRGLPEVLIHKPEDLDGLNGVVVRISSKVGKRKRAQIVELARKKGLYVIGEKNESAKR